MHGLRILLIDNSKLELERLAIALLTGLPAGSIVEKASEPVDALGKLPLVRPNAIIINFSLSAFSVDGEYFLELLHKKAPDVTILAYGRMSTTRHAALAMGAKEYICKPAKNEPQEPFKQQLLQLLLAEPVPKVSNEPSIGSSAIVTREIWRATRKPTSQTATEKSVTTNSLTDTNNTSDEQRDTKLNDTPLIDNVATDTEKPILFKPRLTVPKTTPHINLIAMGASTGGTETLSKILTHLQPPMPGIVIVQHIPPTFSRLFAERLNGDCTLTVKEAASGDIVKPNHVYIAPGGKHMTIKKEGMHLVLTCQPGPPVHSVCPSADVLFDTVATEVGNQSLGVILTGMGHDGATGLLAMRNQGARTIGQDKDSCIVYGMPKTAFEIGAVEQQVTLDNIATTITNLVR